MGFSSDKNRWRRGNHATGMGFTLIEMVVVLLLLSLSLASAAGVFSAYQGRTSALRAAQVFAMDISLARTSAVRNREEVIVDFDEVQVSYLVRFESGDTIVVRRFSPANEISLDSLDLELTGDSLVFDTRGVGDLSGAGSSLGVAQFFAGDGGYDVSFNGMGASKVEKR